MVGGASRRRQVVSELRSGTRRALPALAFGALTLPAVALAETAELNLPEVNVIGTSPLSTVRSARPSTGGGTPRPSRPTAGSPGASPTPAPAPVPTVAADAGMIDRNKVPSNTVTLTAEDFDHSKSTSLADSLLQRVPGSSMPTSARSETRRSSAAR